MNKLILSAAIFSVSLFANAQGVDVAVNVKADAAVSEEVNITADKSSLSIGKTDCIKETGSRIKRAKDKKGCNGLAGNSYEREDIERTGTTNVGEALERLNPSIRITR